MILVRITWQLIITWLGAENSITWPDHDNVVLCGSCDLTLLLECKGVLWTMKTCCCFVFSKKNIYSLRPLDVFVRHQARSSLAQIMACHLIGPRPLPEPMLDYCWLDPGEQISVKFELKFLCFHPGGFHSSKCAWKCLESGVHFVSASMY